MRGGPEGFATGFDTLAKGAGAQWPDLIEANDIHLTPLQPGLVYGTYRYRVRYGSDEHVGISERLFVSTPDGWKIAVTGAIDAPAGTPAPPRALTGATLIDGRGGAPVANANVILRDGKIDCAGTAAQCPLPEGVDVTDVRGMWITPGLIDAHVHFSQTGWADGRPDSLDLRATHPYEQVEAELKANPERYGRSYVCSGVTAVYDVGGYAWTLRLHDRFEPNTLVPHVDAAGPLLSTLDHWLNLPAERQFMVLKDEASARDGVRYLASQGARGQGLVHRPAARPHRRSVGRRRRRRGRRSAQTQPAAHRPRHGAGRGEGVAARRRDAARAQRLGSAGRSGVSRPGQTQRHDRHPDADRLARLRAHVPLCGRAHAGRDRRSERLRRQINSGQARRDHQGSHNAHARNSWRAATSGRRNWSRSPRRI